MNMTRKQTRITWLIAILAVMMPLKNVPVKTWDWLEKTKFWYKSIKTSSKFIWGGSLLACPLVKGKF